MATADYAAIGTGSETNTVRAAARSGRRSLHRIGTVRRQQGVSLRSIARQLNVNIETLRLQEDETVDLQLTDLYRWQEALDVPINDLLVDPGTPLSRPVLERAMLLKLMKTAATLLERSKSVAMRRMAQLMVEQLVEIMPELAEVSPWPRVGKRRDHDEMGHIAEHPIPEDLLRYPQLD